jgi:hypothetical protein
MDQTQRQLMKDRPAAADESSQAGWFLTGGVVLLIGGLILILQSHASVADFGGAMLALIGLALAAASLWLYSQRP